jgi:uncharacterized protein involved in type VI secretion and phage assembly
VSAVLYESIARIARHEAGARAIAAVGRVAEIFPADGAQPDHAVTVELRDSGLVLPRVPIAVGVLGFAAIPAVDDLVVVVFAEGDYHAPVVVGRLYHPDQGPPKHAEGEIVLRLPSGSSDPKLELEVVGAEPVARLKLPGEVLVEIAEERVTLEVGKLHLTLDGSAGRVEIAAGGSQITLKEDGDVAVSSSGKLTLEGTEVEISGSSRVKITGATVEVN